MVDIQYTVLVQLVNFVILILVLNAILLKPMLKHLAERDNKINSSHDEAKGNADKAEALLAEYESELAEARTKAAQAYNSIQQEGLAVQREKLAEAKTKAQEMAEKARAEVAAEAGRAREALKAEMEKLPKDIASKLLGRSI